MCPPLHWGRFSYLRNRRRISTTRRVCRWIFWAIVIPFPFRPLVLPFSLSTLYVLQYMIINRSRPARPVSFPMKDVPLLSRRKRWDYCVSRRSTVPPVVHVHASDADPLLSLPLDESSSSLLPPLFAEPRSSLASGFPHHARANSFAVTSDSRRLPKNIPT